MKFLSLFFVLFILISGCDKIRKVNTQEKLYFCEKYDIISGEINRNDEFNVGKVTVILNLEEPSHLNQIFLEIKNSDKENSFRKIEKAIFPNDEYIYFNEIVFDEPGIYVVKCLNPDGTLIAENKLKIIN